MEWVGSWPAMAAGSTQALPDDDVWRQRKMWLEQAADTGEKEWRMRWRRLEEDWLCGEGGLHVALLSSLESS